jgi:hypothetical protein
MRRLAWQLEPTPWLPLRAARTATRYTWRYGATVPTVGRERQWREQFQFRTLYRCSSDSYYRYRLYESSRRPDVPAFMELCELMATRRWLYAATGIDTEDLGDKTRFGRRARAAGLPTPPVLATIAAGAIVHAPATLPEHDLFTKDGHSLCGKGATYWRWQGDGTYTSTSGATIARDALLPALAREAARGSVVVQPRMVNHPQVSPLSAAGLCTVRVMTSRAPNSAPVVLRACFRMPVDAEAADNFAHGGLASPIDLETGVLGRAVQKALEHAAECYDTHPTTGSPITGTALPLWSDVLDLGVRAHEAFGEFVSVGWDIGITPAGPVLIEGNYNWDIVLAQQPHGSSLAETPLGEHFWAYVPAHAIPQPAVA